MTQRPQAQPHAGVVLTGRNGADGTKAFFVEIEARPDKVAEAQEMLREILGWVEGEPQTGPWYGVQFGPTTFGIFDVFPSIAARQAHADGGGGDILRDLERMNDILAAPARVHRADVLLSKQVFTASE